MPEVWSLISPMDWALAVCVTLVASFVKGAVGFAMPMIMISGMGSFLSAEVALAAILLPTLLTNAWQGMRGGFAAARAAAHKHLRFLLILTGMIVVCAQLVAVFSDRVMYLLLGLPITGFAVMQLSGTKLVVPLRHRVKAEVGLASFAGFMGGVSGIWGPPTVAWLTASDTPKTEQIRVLGVLFALGSVVLTAAHVRSGVLNERTSVLSGLMLIPAFLGMIVGLKVQDRMDQAKFQRWTLIVLVIAGLNLVRRGLMS